MTGIETMLRLAKRSAPFVLGVVANSGCGETVVHDNDGGTGGVAGAAGSSGRSASEDAGAGGASAGGASSGGSPLSADMVPGSGGATPGGGGASFGGAIGVLPGTGGVSPAVPCGSNVCVPPPALLPGFGVRAPCCVDPFAGICGTTASAFSGFCQPPLPPDPRCPSAQTMLGSFNGCCTDNDCGLDMSNLGLGCVDTANAMISAFLPTVMPMHCDGTPFELDAGGSGAGGAGAVGDASAPDGARGAAYGAAGGSGSRGSDRGASDASKEQ